MESRWKINTCSSSGIFTLLCPYGFTFQLLFLYILLSLALLILDAAITLQSSECRNVSSKVSRLIARRYDTINANGPRLLQSAVYRGRVEKYDYALPLYEKIYRRKSGRVVIKFSPGLITSQRYIVISSQSGGHYTQEIVTIPSIRAVCTACVLVHVPSNT